MAIAGQVVYLAGGTGVGSANGGPHRLVAGVAYTTSVSNMTVSKQIAPNAVLGGGGNDLWDTPMWVDCGMTAVVTLDAVRPNDAVWVTANVNLDLMEVRTIILKLYSRSDGGKNHYPKALQ